MLSEQPHAGGEECPFHLCSVMDQALASGKLELAELVSLG